MAIASPINSFVDFNTPNTDCLGNERDVSLPVYNDFGIKFQIKIEDDLLPANTIFYAAACSEDCQLIYDPNYQVIPICSRFKFWTNDGALVDSIFPLLVGNYAPVYGQPQVPEGLYTKEEFLQIVSDAYEVELPGYDFYSCCELPVISGIVVFFNGAGIAKSVAMNEYFGYGYVNFPATAIGAYVAPNGCFRYCILNAAKVVQVCSNLFYRIIDPCYTTVFNYYNEENGYDFKYVVYDDAGTNKITENQIRLSVSFLQPTHLIEENIFRRSDKVQQRLSTLIEKEWQGETAYFSVNQHDKFVVLLKHDILNVRYDNYDINRRMTQIGALEPVFPEVKNFPTYPVTFKIRDYAYSYTNNNCGFSCGVELVDACEAGGGIAPECPDKYSIEFAMTEGQATYQDNNLIGLTNGVEVYREGLIQYTTGGNNYSFNSVTGTVTFVPVSYGGERIAIIEV